MGLPFKSLNVATDTGVGEQKDFETVLFHHSIWLTHSENPSSFNVNVEASLEGSSFFSIGSISTLGGNANFDFPARYIRARLTAISGADADVTAWLASCL